MSEGEKQKRILFGVTSSLSLGLMAGIAEHLTAKGWEVHVAASPIADDRNVLPKGVPFHPIAMERDPAILRDLGSLVTWIRLLTVVRPDVVSVGTPKAGLLGSVAAWVCKVPRRTYHLRGLRLESETGLRFRVLKALESVASWCATDVLAISPSLRDKAIGLNLVPETKINVLGRGSSNGVDTKRYRPNSLSGSEIAGLKKSLGIDAEIPIIGFVGRLVRDKGVAELARASAYLHRAGVPHQLLIVGPEEENLRDPWSEAGLSPAQRPIFVGKVLDTAPYYQLMTVFAFPTHREGLGNVLLEAGASGIPTVTTQATGARDAIVDGSTGITVPVGDSEALGRALKFVLEDSSIRRSYSEQGRAFVKEHFSRTEVWDRLGEYYSSDVENIKAQRRPMFRGGIGQ